MRKVAALLVFVSVLFSCQDIEKTPKPENLIPEEKMVKVLTDISLLHGARTFNRKLMEEKGISPYEYLWEKYRIDSSQFRKSNDYYAENYKQYQRIYDSVKSRLEILQLEYDKIREREERRQDSIRELDTLKIKKDIPKDTLIPFDLKDRRILADPASARRDRDSVR